MQRIYVIFLSVLEIYISRFIIIISKMKNIIFKMVNYISFQNGAINQNYCDNESYSSKRVYYIIIITPQTPFNASGTIRLAQNNIYNCHWSRKRIRESCGARSP